MAKRQPSITPLRLTSRLRCQISSVTSTTVPGKFTPALLKSTSTRPKVSTAGAHHVLDHGRLRDVDRDEEGACPPSCLIRAAVSSPAVDGRSATTTSAPSRAKRCADARPIPEAAPVTMATLPSSFFTGLHLPRCSARPTDSRRRRQPAFHSARRFAGRPEIYQNLPRNRVLRYRDRQAAGVMSCGIGTHAGCAGGRRWCLAFVAEMKCGEIRF